MKRLITASIVLLSLGTSAFAMAPNTGLSASTAQEARRFVPNGDFENLTTAQVNAIADAVYGDSEHVAAQIRSILMWN